MKTILLFLFAVLFLVSCSENSTTTQDKGRITGSVVDKETGSGLSFSYIKTNPPTEAPVTDSLGYFEINNLSEGTYTIIATRAGYVTDSVPVKVSNSKVSNANIPLSKAGETPTLPQKPVYILPANNSTIPTPFAGLVWVSPDSANDNLTYDVYFDMTNPPAKKIATNISTRNYPVNNLMEGTTYYWKVVVKNSKGKQQDGDVWSFSFKKQPFVINPEGLVAYYPFNGNAMDESGNGHDGKENGVTIDNDHYGNPNSSFKFNGKSYIEVQFSPDFDFKEDFSIAAWIKPNFEMAHPYDEHIDILSRLTDNFFDFGITTYHCLEYFIRTGYNNEYIKSKDNMIIGNQWNHIAVVFKKEINQNTGVVTLYINGETAAQQKISRAPAVNNGNLRIGARPDNNSTYAGSIDEIYIFKRVLSDMEIKTLSK